MEGLRPAPTSKRGTGKRTAGSGGGWTGKAALVLSLLALTVSGVVLYLLLGDKEPEYLTYREQQTGTNMIRNAFLWTARGGSSTSLADDGACRGSMFLFIRGRSTGRQWPTPAWSLP